MLINHIISAAVFSLIAFPVFAQDTDCTDGQVLNPNTGACKTNSDTGSGGGGIDDGLIPKDLRFLGPNPSDRFVEGTPVSSFG